MSYNIGKGETIYGLLHRKRGDNLFVRLHRKRGDNLYSRGQLEYCVLVRREVFVEDLPSYDIWQSFQKQRSYKFNDRKLYSTVWAN